MQHVPERSAGGRGHDADAPREAGRGALARGIEESFGRKLLLERLEAPPELAFAGLLQVIDDQLELASRLVQADAGPQQDLHAVARRDPDREVALAEHRAAHLGVLVLEREIPVPRRRAGQVRKLPGDPERRQAGLEQPARLAIQAADRINVAARLRRTT